MVDITSRALSYPAAVLCDAVWVFHLISVLSRNKAAVEGWRGKDWKKYNTVMTGLLDKIIDRWSEQLGQKCKALLREKTMNFHRCVFGVSSENVVDVTDSSEGAVPLQQKATGAVVTSVFNRAIKSIVAAVKAGYKKPEEEKKRLRKLKQDLVWWKEGAEQLVSHTHTHPTQEVLGCGCCPA
jgi:hypothetical protein